MIEGLKPYLAYKDSELPWMGAIPVHWEVRRLDKLFTLRAETPIEGDQRVTGYLDGRVTLRSNVQGQKIKGVVKEVGWQRVYPGDFAISGMNAHLGGMGVSESLGKCSPIYLVLQPKHRTDAHFVSLATRHAAHSGALKALVNTIRFNSADFKREDLKKIWIALPREDEQSSIVHFLGHVNRRIQRYIRTKKKLVALLNEQKQAIIHGAVTRGLDPDVRLKPSGVEWLGEVPEHWEIWKVGHLGMVGNGSTPSRGNNNYWHGGTYPWLNSGSVNRRLISSADQFVTRLALQECHLPRVRPGSVLVAITGQGKTRATAATLEIEATINQRLAYITPRKDEIIATDYLFLAFAGAYRELRAISDDSGSTKGALTCSDIKRFKVALPPLEEQAKIVSAVRIATQSADGAIVHAEREINLLHEYRTRLIADVVTGKRDVREAAARLPEEIEDLEPLDEGEALADEDGEGESAEIEDFSEEAVA